MRAAIVAAVVLVGHGVAFAEPVHTLIEVANFWVTRADNEVWYDPPGISTDSNGVGAPFYASVGQTTSRTFGPRAFFGWDEFEAGWINWRDDPPIISGLTHYEPIQGVPDRHDRYVSVDVDLGDFDPISVRAYTITFGPWLDDNIGFQVRGFLDVIGTWRAVPEPSAGLLLFSLLFVRRRHRR